MRPRFISSTVSQVHRCFSSAAVRSAAVIERRPIIIDAEPWQEEYAEFQSYNHEADHPMPENWHKYLSLSFKQSGVPDESEIADEEVQKKMREDFVRLRDEYNVTDADRNNDRTSLMRALPHHLYLIVKDKDSEQWNFPQGEHEPQTDGKSLRKTAERHLKKITGTDLPYWIFANVPSGHLDKTFFYQGEVVFDSGGRIPTRDIVHTNGEFAWVTRSELAEEYFADRPELAQTVAGMLML